MTENTNPASTGVLVFDGRSTVEHAAAVAEALRAINHLAAHDNALPFPSGAYRLTSDLATTVYRLPQAFTQIASRVGRWRDAGQLSFDSGSPYADHADQAVEEVQRWLCQDAARAADNLARVLDATAQLLAAAHYAGPLADEARP
jgi:hypothetical protein